MAKPKHFCKCGKLISADREMCWDCKRTEPVQVICPECGESRMVERAGAEAARKRSCKSCTNRAAMKLRAKTLITVACRNPECGKPFQVTPQVALRRRNWKGLCPDCLIVHNANRHKEYQAKREETVSAAMGVRVQINGCTIAPSYKPGERCADFLHCRHYDDCLDVAVDGNWPAFRRVSGQMAR